MRPLNNGSSGFCAKGLHREGAIAVRPQPKAGRSPAKTWFDKVSSPRMIEGPDAKVGKTEVHSFEEYHLFLPHLASLPLGVKSIRFQESSSAGRLTRPAQDLSNSGTKSTKERNDDGKAGKRLRCQICGTTALRWLLSAVRRARSSGLQISEPRVIFVVDEIKVVPGCPTRKPEELESSASAMSDRE